MLDKKIQDILHRIDGLSAGEIKQWLEQVLQGGGDFWPTDGEVSRASSISAVFENLNENTQGNVKQAASDLLEEWLANPDNPDSLLIQELLFLVQYLEIAYCGQMLFEHFERIGYENLDPDLRFRIIQTIVALGIKPEKEFWFRVLSWTEPRYAALIFLGLAASSPELAIKILAFFPDGKDAARLVRYTLPGFFKQIGRNDYERLQNELWQESLKFGNAFLMNKIHEYLRLKGFQPGVQGVPPRAKEVDENFSSVVPTVADDEIVLAQSYRDIRWGTF